jgi:ribosomal protein L27
MAHKKGGGTTRNGRDSESKRLGVKVYGGQKSMLAALSFVNAAHVFTQVKTLVGKPHSVRTDRRHSEVRNQRAAKHQYAIVVAA